MANRWNLSEEVRQKYVPIVQDFINKLESASSHGESQELNLSDTELNPYTLTELLESIGYEVINRDDNGWQLDYWITMSKSGFKSLWMNGTGIIFELKLSEYV